MVHKVDHMQSWFAERFIEINGSYSNVVGLPLYETVNLLKSIKVLIDYLMII